MSSRFRRDRLTWVAYLMLSWFAYLQGAPGQVVPHLRDELDLSYTVGGLHVAAFAGGSVVSGLFVSRLDSGLRGGVLLWRSALCLGAGTVGLTIGGTVPVTVGSILVMGFGGGLLLATVQAGLTDHHGERRTVALAEANVAASVSYVVLIGAFSLAAAVGLGWRPVLLASLLIPLSVWLTNRRLPMQSAGHAENVGAQRLPAVFWVAVAVLMCATAAEWCVNSWTATFVSDSLEVTTDTAVSLMAVYFGGVVAGRILGSRLAQRYEPARLFACAVGVAFTGFTVLWLSTALVPAVLGLALLGLGLGNMFPMGLAVAMSLAPGRSGVASGRVVSMTSLSVLIAPLLVGTFADVTSLSTALLLVPALLVCAAAGLVAVRQHESAARPHQQPPLPRRWSGARGREVSLDASSEHSSPCEKPDDW